MLEQGITFSLIVFAVTLIALIVLKFNAAKIGLVDHPCERKRHESATPVVGGLALCLGLFPLVIVPSQFTMQLLCWGLPALILVVIGFIDDVIEVKSTHRLLMHLLAGFSLVPIGFELVHLGDLLGLGNVYLGYFAIPVTLFAVAASINSFNMIDGLDGLLALVSIAPLAILSWLAFSAGLSWEFILALSLMMSVTAFSLFNVRFPWVSRASLFMGDAGSTLIGFSVAWLTIALAMQSAITPVLALYLLSVPLLDTAGVIYRRRIRKVSASTPGRDHLHHILLDLGLSVRLTVLLIATVNFLVAMLGVLMWRSGVNEYIMFFAFLVITVAYVTTTRVPARIKQRIFRAKRSNVI